MNYFIKLNQDSSFYFDTKVFLDKQKEIFFKYYHKIKDNTKVENLDKFLLLTLEEVSEARYGDSDEIIDILMYLGSTLYCFDEFENKNNNIIIEYNNRNKSSEQELNDLRIQLLDKLINIRRMFPERKFHKNYDPDKDINTRREEYSISIIFDAMRLILNYFQSKDYSIQNIDSLITNKQEFILNNNNY